MQEIYILIYIFEYLYMYIQIVVCKQQVDSGKILDVISSF